MRKFIDYTDTKVGSITIVKFYGQKENSRHYYWVGKCSCGNEILLRATEIRQKKRKSCKKCNKSSVTHGMTNTRLFNIWQTMKDRCYNKKSKNYYMYGKKGIKVCKKWENSFVAFYEWAVNNGYNQKLSIDRIDNKKGYNPQNCRWASNVEQANNKRNNIMITYKGITDTLPNWSRKTGINKSVLQYRFYNNWDVEKMLTVKPIIGRNQYDK